jgi:DNA-binding MarR family transcriptional regulator
MAEDTVDRIRTQTGRSRDDSSAAEVLSRLYRLMANIEPRVNDLYGSFDLTRGEAGVLGALERSQEPSLTPGRLAALLMCSSGAMTNRLDRLENDGLIERMPDPNDRRGTRIAITRAGRARTRAATAERERLDPELIPGLSAAERRTLVGLLRKLLVAYETQDAQGHGGARTGDLTAR